MVSIDVKFDQKQLEKLLKTLEKAPEECRKGAVSAINRSVKTTNTALQKAITTRYNIKKKRPFGRVCIQRRRIKQPDKAKIGDRVEPFCTN